MIKVTSKLNKAHKTEGCYHSHVTIEGVTQEIASEMEALLNAFLNNPLLEDIYLRVSTEIAKAHVEDLKRTLEDLKND